MILPKILAFSLAVGVLPQAKVLVVKNNGDELRLTYVEFYLEDKVSHTSEITFSQDEITKAVSISKIRRINLKDVSRRKGVSTWNALMVMKDNKKIEITISLDRISGIDDDGKRIEISSSSIDKISF